jgi:PAS domain S-box-containing protein
LIAVLAPWIGNLLYLSGLSPLGLDTTPFAFTISALAITWGIYGVQLMEILPIARSIIIEEMGEGVIVLNMENHIIDINPSALRMLGLSGSRLIGQNITDHLGKWGYLAKKYTGVMEAIDEITLGEGEAQRWFEFHLSALRDKQSNVVGKMVTITNITDRKRTENLLRESEASYRQIVENASDIIYRTDAQGCFTYANPTTLNLMGLKSESEVLGKHYLEFAAPRFRHDLKRFYERQYMARETNTYNEFVAVTARGDEIWLGQNVQIIKEDDQIVGFQAVARDITDLKQAQEELALARDQAIEANRFKSLMLAKVSHELRTPLGGILGYAELLQSAAFGALHDNQKYAVSQVIDSTHYLTKMINDLLDEAQIESKTIRLHPDRFAPSKLLHGVESSMAVLAGQKGLTLTTSIASNLPELLYGDEQRLQQILVNLVSNAIKYTERGEVRINLSSPDPVHWTMQVSDTGAGIPEEARAYIFEPFRQVDNKITHSNRGTGLGLSICKQLVELMGGQISLESKVGQGSTFNVCLPLTKNTESVT